MRRCLRLLDLKFKPQVALRSVGQDEAERAGWERNVRQEFDSDDLRSSELLQKMENKYYVKKSYTRVEEVFPLLDKKRWYGLTEKSMREKQQHLIQQPNDPYLVKAAILGAPNVGKSTLMNAMVGSRVSAESHKVGSTNKWVKGVTNVHNTQLVLLDTPGVFHTGASQSLKQKHQNHSFRSWDAISSADVVCYCHQAGIGFVDNEHKAILREVAKRTAARRLPLLLVMTKMDQVHNGKKTADMYASLRTELSSINVPFSGSFETSAFGATGIVDLKDYIARFAKKKKWEYSGTADSTLTPPDRAFQMIKQAMFAHMPHKTPYQSRTEVFGWTQEKDHIEIAVEVMFEHLMDYRVFLTKLTFIREHATNEIQRELKKKVRLVLFGFVAEKSFTPN